MLDPRIYRTGLVAAVLAVIIAAFSLQDQQGPLGTTLAPEAFNGQNAFATMSMLAAKHPQRRPGSASDYDLATYVASQLRQYGFALSTDLFKGKTVDGARELENVTGVRTGLSSGTIVVVAHRDALGSPASADLSGTAVLVELARVLSGATQQRTLVLASTSGSDGSAGAARLASELPKPVDAVIVLGDLAGTRLHQPVVVPWSNSDVLAPPMLRNTLGAALRAQAFLKPGTTSLAGELAHLVFPMALTEQGPFGARGEPALLLSLAGARSPAADEPTSPATITRLGRTLLETISALDGGAAVPAPSGYLLIDGKVLPGWAIRLLVLAFMLPVLVATIDALARAHRRGHSVWPGLIWVLSSAIPFLMTVFVVVIAKVTGLIAVAPPGPVSAGEVALHGSGIAVLAIAGCSLVLGFVLVRPLVIRLAVSHLARRGGRPSAAGAGGGTLVLLSLVSLALWRTNVFAAILLIPAMHLWIWVADPTVRLRRVTGMLLLLAGLAPAALLIVYYAHTLGLGPIGTLWNGVLLLAGGSVGIWTAVEWSLLLGCALSVGLIALRARRRAQEQPAVSGRGPTYAGPGSLGGTQSALRR